MPTSFKASLITPEAILFETDVTGAQIPAFDGLVGILHQRAPLLARLGTGVLRLDGAAGSERFVVTGGYAQMKDNVLTILTSDAVPAKQVNAQMIAAEQAKLDAIDGIDMPAMQKRQSQQARIHAMKSLAN